MAQAATGKEQLSGSPLQGVLLALLVGEEQPLHGYMLATLAERRLGPAWDITRQSVYGALHRLEVDELVYGWWRTAGNRRGRGRKVYSATDQAEAALTAWMERPLSREPLRIELQARLAMSRPRDAPQLLRALDWYERDCFQALADAQEAEVPMSSWAGVTLNLTRKATDERLQADLRWSAIARRSIEDFVAEISGEPTQ